MSNIYGGKKATLYFFYFKIKYIFGYYSKYSNIDCNKFDRIVFVCKGNICRSPYAEAYAISKGYNSSSFGLDARSGTKADSKASRVANNFNIDLSCSHSRRIEDMTISRTDLIVTMEPSQAYQLESRPGIENSQITMLGLWGNNANPYIHDPYGAGEHYFTNCFRRINECIDNLLTNLNK